MLPQPGNWRARTDKGVVYETEGGALMAAFDFTVDEQTSIIGRFCLASKAGEVQQGTMRSLREAFGWDGADPFWLADTDLSDREVEIVVDLEKDQNGEDRPRVRWLNAPGKGHGMPEAGDRKAILAKYGAKFRALAGGTTVRPAVAAPAPRPAPAAAKAPPAPARPAGQAATIQEAWEAFCKAAGDKSEQEINDMWFRAVQELTGKRQDQCQPEDWDMVKAGAADWINGQLPY